MHAIQHRPFFLSVETCLTMFECSYFQRWTFVTNVACLVLVTRYSWMLIWENWPSTWFHFHDYISSCLGLHHWRHVEVNSIELWPFQNWPSRCSTRKTWWRLVTLVMVDIWPWPPSSEDKCQCEKLMNKCWTFRTKTLASSLSGFQTTSKLPFVIFHQGNNTVLRNVPLSEVCIVPKNPIRSQLPSPKPSSAMSSPGSPLKCALPISFR